MQKAKRWGRALLVVGSVALAVAGADRALASKSAAGLRLPERGVLVAEPCATRSASAGGDLDLRFSEDRSEVRIEIDGAALVGERIPGGPASEATYLIEQGLPAGGTFEVREDLGRLEGTFTISGSGVPVLGQVCGELRAAR